MPLSNSMLSQFAGGTLEISEQKYPIEDVWVSGGALIHVVFAEDVAVPPSAMPGWEQVEDEERHYTIPDSCLSARKNGAGQLAVRLKGSPHQITLHRRQR